MFRVAFSAPPPENRPIVLYIKLKVNQLPVGLANEKIKFQYFIIHFLILKLNVFFLEKGAYVFTCSKRAIDELFSLFLQHILVVLKILS